jgi:DNA-binding NarL/FixJ family response regulator
MGGETFAMRAVDRKASVVKRVLVADDHTLMRQGLRYLLEKEGDFQCVAEAEDGLEAVKMARQFHPDIVIMDIVMPNLNGIEATRQIKAEHPPTEVVVLSMHATRAYVAQVLQAGAAGYLVKDSAFEELVTALRSVSRGEMYLSPAISKGTPLGELTGKSSSGDFAHRERLTSRETQVLQMIAEGRSTKEIAARLEVSVKTVETHRKQIMDKLEMRSVAALTKYCIREGLTSL